MKRFFNKKAMIVFALPALLVYSAFVIFPLFPQILISFQEHNGITSEGWVGLDNFRWVFENERFWKSNLNVLFVIAVSTLIGLPISLILALVLDFQRKTTRRLFKTVAFIPSILSVTVLAQMFTAILNPQWGLVNTILENIGLEELATSWLTDENTAMPAIAFVFIWQYLGFNMVLFYAGLKSIPNTYFEAALIDGAGPVKSSIFITIPLLQEVVKYVLLISVLGCMALYTHVLLLTKGGPGDTSMTPIYVLFDVSFKAMDFGRGCAIAVVYLIECVFISFIINKFVARTKVEF